MQDFEDLASWLVSNPPDNVEPAPRMPEAVPLDTRASGHSQPNQRIAPTPSTDDGSGAIAPPANSGGNPALTRAAELVERARELSTRTAQLSHRMSRQVAQQQIEEPIPPQQPEGSQHVLQPVAAIEPAPQRPGLKEKLDRIYGIRHTAEGVLFVQPAQEVGRVGIAGDFNNWNPSSTPMTRDEQLHVWKTCIRIPPGRYRYRLVVDGQWVQDPYNTQTETNPFGELNNVVEVA